MGRSTLTIARVHHGSPDRLARTAPPSRGFLSGHLFGPDRLQDPPSSRITISLG